MSLYKNSTVQYKMANKWLAHVKKTMKTMKSKGTYKKGDGLKKVIMEAKKTYAKSDSAAPTKTRRRRHR
jgi:hypothetical protein